MLGFTMAKLKGTKIRMFNAASVYEVTGVGVFTPNEKAVDALQAGMVGFITASIKSLDDVLIGDTLMSPENPITEAMPGFKPIRQMVFCGLYPSEGDDYENLKVALEKLKLNDCSISFEPDTSQALGLVLGAGFWDFYIPMLFKRDWNVSSI